jgi:hypothetical protein
MNEQTLYHDQQMDKRINNVLPNTIQETKDWAKQTPLKTGKICFTGLVYYVIAIFKSIILYDIYGNVR